MDPLADPHDGAAEDLRVHRNDGDHLLAQLPAQGLLDAPLERLVGRAGQGDAGADPVELEVEQRLVLRRDLAQELLPPALHQRLQEQHELARRALAARRRAAAPSPPWAPGAT